MSLFKRAVEIDPNFAMACAQLGFTYGLIGEPGLAAENNSRAYQLRDRASEAEKFFITASYDLQVTGNLERALQTCELWAQTYPRLSDPNSLLGAFLSPHSAITKRGSKQLGGKSRSIPTFRSGIFSLPSICSSLAG